jgi:hypothetical protein
MVTIDDAERLLRQAGWHPGRRQDITAIRELLETRGYDIPATTEDFFQEYDGLVIRFERHNREDSINFSVERVCAIADPEWITYYGSQLGTPLTPVGFANFEHLVIMQSSDGSFYVGYDEFFARVGATPLEMIRNIVSQNIRSQNNK